MIKSKCLCYVETADVFHLINLGKLNMIKLLIACIVYDTDYFFFFVFSLLPEDSAKTGIIVTVLLVILGIVIAVSAYVYIFHRKKIKQWLQPPYEIPQVSTDTVQHTDHTTTWSPGMYTLTIS